MKTNTHLQLREGLSSGQDRLIYLSGGGDGISKLNYSNRTSGLLCLNSGGTVSSYYIQSGFSTSSFSNYIPTHSCLADTVRRNGFLLTSSGTSITQPPVSICSYPVQTSKIITEICIGDSSISNTFALSRGVNSVITTVASNCIYSVLYRKLKKSNLGEEVGLQQVFGYVYTTSGVRYVQWETYYSVITNGQQAAEYNIFYSGGNTLNVYTQVTPFLLSATRE